MPTHLQAERRKLVTNARLLVGGELNTSACCERRRAKLSSSEEAREEALLTFCAKFSSSSSSNDDLGRTPCGKQPLRSLMTRPTVDQSVSQSSS